MRYHYWGKFLLYIIVAILLLFTYITVRDNNPNPEKGNTEIIISSSIPVKKHVEVHTDATESYEHTAKKEVNLKYILQWTSSKTVPFVYMGKGQEGFIKRSCKYTNCYVTDDDNYLEGITKFDVVVFGAPEVLYMNAATLPEKRSPHQKYAFATIESPQYYSVRDNILDEYFNWTWTFKLDSDTRWGYIIIRDTEGHIIGPNKDMHWIKTEDMKPVPKELLSILKGKSEAAAWFVSNCFSKSNREQLAEDLQSELIKYGLKIDVFGDCGKLKCPRTNEEMCDRLVEKHYYFYLAFENSLSEDYVTEKILRGLQYSAIPIVYGGANYTRLENNYKIHTIYNIISSQVR